MKQKINWKLTWITIIIIITVGVIARVTHTNAEIKEIKQNKIGEILDILAKCESRQQVNIKYLDSNDRYSYGFLQFQKLTWQSQIKHFGLFPNAEPAETMNLIYDKENQKLVARKMLEEDWQNRRNWKNCWRIMKLPTTRPNG